MSSNAGTLTIFTNIQSILDKIVPILISLAVVYFLWGLSVYILNAGNEESKTKGRGVMLWGIIAIFVMVSLWGFVSMLQDTTGIKNTTITYPTLPKK